LILGQYLPPIEDILPLLKTQHQTTSTFLLFSKTSQVPFFLTSIRLEGGFDGSLCYTILKI